MILVFLIKVYLYELWTSHTELNTLPSLKQRQKQKFDPPLIVASIFIQENPAT